MGDTRTDKMIIAAAGDYAAEDVISDSASAGRPWLFPKMARYKGGGGYITQVHVLWETTALTPRTRVYFFNARPTSNLNDNVANTAVLLADVDKAVGYADVPSLSDLGGMSEGIATMSTFGNLALRYDCNRDDDSLQAILVTRDAITGEVAGKTVAIKVGFEAD